MIRIVGRVAAATLLSFALAGFANRRRDQGLQHHRCARAALEELTPKFEKASGHKLTITWGTAAMLVKRVQGGESADLYVLTRQSHEALAKAGKAADGSDAIFASSGMAIGGQIGRAQAGHLHRGGVQADAAQGQSDRLFQSGRRWRQWRVSRQTDRAHGHRRRAEGQDQASAGRWQCRQARGQRRGGTRRATGAGGDVDYGRRSGRAAAAAI